MKCENVSLSGVLIVYPDVFTDDRGFFFESYSKEKYAEIGIHDEFVQDNHSRSQKGVSRGMHLQIGAHAQAKLVRVVSGSVLDVVLDLRKDSSTFGKSFSLELSEENKKQLFIPAGLAHGFQVLTDFADFIYKIDQLYSAEHERGINWQDASVYYHWRELNIPPLISDKDENLKFWNQSELYFE